MAGGGEAPGWRTGGPGLSLRQVDSVVAVSDQGISSCCSGSHGGARGLRGACGPGPHAQHPRAWALWPEAPAHLSPSQPPGI